MEYENMPASSNIEDRRGQGGGGGGLAMGGGGLGIGAIIVIFALSYFTGISPQVLMSGAEMVAGNQSQQAPRPSVTADPNDPTRNFLSRVVGGTEAVWAEVLPAQTGVRYAPATLVIYDGATRSGCGGARSAMGPFYCPIDKKVYLDTSFFRDMKTKYGGGGEFAYAYVVAHEIGHHVQDLLGILGKVDDGQAAREPDPGQRAFGEGRAAGRLPCRRLGRQRQPEMADSRTGRHRTGARDRASDRRRPIAVRRARLRRARQLHPRLLGHAPAMADHGLEERAGQFLQHLRELTLASPRAKRARQSALPQEFGGWGARSPDAALNPRLRTFDDAAQPRFSLSRWAIACAG